MNTTSFVSQNLIVGPKLATRLEVRHFPRRNAGDAVKWLVDNTFPWSQNAIPVGISLDQDHSQQISAISLATSTRAASIMIDESSVRDLKLIMHDAPFISLMSGKGKFGSKNSRALYGIDEEENYKNSFVLVGFDFARVTVLVRKYVGIDVRGVDLGTLLSPTPLMPWSPGRMVRARVSQEANQWTINKCWDQREDKEAFFMRSWISLTIAERCQSEIALAVHVDTARLNLKELQCVQDMVAETFWLEQLRPIEAHNDFGSLTTRKDGKIELHNDRFKTRVRRSERQEVVITTTAGREYNTRARGVKGKTTTLGKLNIPGQVQSVRTVGRQDPTNSERLADFLLLSVLQGKKTFQASPFIRLFWFPTWKAFQPPEDSGILKPGTMDAVLEVAKLNESQQHVVRMVESKERVVIVHGPPGTGKTTTIAAISRVWDLNDCPVWIIAHSNVAVKNIAISLNKRNVDFKIIVSKEFYEEWHEHMYSAVQDKLIRSDELPDSPVAVERLVGDSCIMLSTLGMLSNPALEQKGLFKLVPMERLIVDEASQIRIFEFLHLFEMFPLEKIFFFGDPQQLPPFNSDQVSGMKTIFDLDHLNTPQRRFLLNTQYRMPVPVGDFVSKFVYDGKLLSSHEDTLSNCVLFVNVPSLSQGAEARVEKSWVNEGEVRTVVNLVNMYYKQKDFAVITPYDAQRGLIENALKAEGLPWENSVFNIDTFQGHERTFIIVSLVRTDKPGFLKSMNRLNVMLTRSKKGMVVVANKDFLFTKGSNTLVASFANYWRRTYGHAGVWASASDISKGTVDVPGVSAPNPTGTALYQHRTSNYGAAGVPASQSSAYVPAKYQSADGSGSFDVSKLFAKSRPQVYKKTVDAFDEYAPISWGEVSYPAATSFWDDETGCYVNYGLGSYYSPTSMYNPYGTPVTRARRPAPPAPTFNSRSFPSLGSATAVPSHGWAPALHSHSLVGKKNAWQKPLNSTPSSPLHSPTSPTSYAGWAQQSAYSQPTSRYVSSQTYRTTPSSDYTRRTNAPKANTKSYVSSAVDSDGAWTRVERRKGHGRKTFLAPPKPTYTPAPSKQSIKKRGYRYWAALD